MLETEPRFSFVIPAYNEAERIETTLKDLIFRLDYHSKFNGNYELLIIMDGCEDGTLETVKGLIKDHFGVRAIVRPDRLGKGGAIIEALKYAKGDLIAFIDADGSIPSSELNKLVEMTDKYDLVIGSRYEKSSVLPRRRPLSRLVCSRSFNVLLKLMFWRLRGLKDTQCGVKVFSKDLIDTINGDFLIADFAFDVNLVYSAVRHGFKVKEVGITWVEKDGGNVSRELLKHSFIMAFSLLRLRIYYSPFKGILNSQPFRKIANLFYRG
ncbi:MAG: glycosyltransferase [Candidatus Bathyarchaeia archaeon]|jgi:glycosyltransferase involved in cell wall biosynthesis